MIRDPSPGLVSKSKPKKKKVDTSKSTYLGKGEKQEKKGRRCLVKKHCWRRPDPKLNGEKERRSKGM